MRFSISLNIFLLLVVCVIAACNTGPDGQRSSTPLSGGKKLIGFAQSETDNPWRIAETRSIQDEAVKRSDKYELIMTNAEGKISKQIADVEDLIARRVDAILLVPREAEALRPALQKAKAANVPVFLIDREHAGTPGVDFVTFIGSNFREEGQRLGKWVVENTGGNAGIVILEGTKGASVTRDRSIGFREVIEPHPRLRVLDAQPADFQRADAQVLTENFIKRFGRQITVVYAHSDEMALGAIQALKSAGMNPGRDVKIVSVDGQRSALEAIIAGDLNASVECNPRFGPIAFDTLDRFFRGEPLPPKIIVPDKMYDASNAAQFLHEAY